MKVNGRTTSYGDMVAYECTCSASDNDHKLAQVRRIIWQRIASIIRYRGIVARDKDRQCGSDGQGESVEVGDWIVCDAVHGGVL